MLTLILLTLVPKSLLKNLITTKGEINIYRTVYIKIRHWLFWYGYYGLCDKSCNDEVTIYQDKDETCFLGYFEISTETSLAHHLNNEAFRVNDNEYFTEINDFINSKHSIYYSYTYPRCKDDLSCQVKHFAPIDNRGYKPIYIHMWSKISVDLDINEMSKLVKIIMKDFFDSEILNVEILEMPTYEEVELSYEQDYKPYVK